MRAAEIITKKRDGQELSDQEIHWFIEKYTAGEIPDYQASAWLMAVYFRGMSPHETAVLTDAMAQSGETLDPHVIAPRTVDKHSSGGVGDKTTLVVGPIVASTGLPVAKMSGRGLGFTGGTLDKLESIPGFDVSLDRQELLKQVKEIGLVIASQTAQLAPADGKLYALRDVTGTVDSLPLIASSIMSKKLAGGNDAIVLDVKVGSGAFMTTVETARELAEMMVDIGERNGREVTALLSDMNQPLGCAVGNALEVKESIETLRGNGPADFTEHCLVIAAHMLFLGNKAQNVDAARTLAETQLQNGAALEKFVEMVAYQGGDTAVVDDPDAHLEHATFVESLPAPEAGYLAAIEAREIGLTTVMLGGGREKKGDPIDHAVGIVVHKQVGDAVKVGEPVLTIHANTHKNLEEARARLQQAIRFSAEPVEPLPLFYDVVSTRDI